MEGCIGMLGDDFSRRMDFAGDLSTAISSSCVRLDRISARDAS